MKNNRTVVMIILAFVILIGGAGFLYNSLAKNYQRDSFVTVNPNKDVESLNADNDISNDSTLAHSHAEEEESKETQPAPDFTVYDAAGKKINLSDYLGKPVVLNFWASWCGPCKSEMPGFDNLYKEYGDSVEFLMVNLTDGMQETQEKADNFMKEEGYSFPIYYDHDSSAAYTYGISSIPTTFLINTEGNIEAYAMGAISEDALENALDMIVEK